MRRDTHMKKKLACLLALLLMVTSVLGSTTVASAANGNARGGGTEYDKIRITGISFPEFSEEGYYPASLEQLLLTFEGVVSYKGDRTDYVYNRNYDEESSCYRADTVRASYGLYFYTKDGTPVQITNDSVPVGEYIVIFQRLGDGEGFEVGTIKILDPTSKMQETTNKKAHYESASSENYDESWFSLGELTGEYAYYAPNFSNDYWFASIWTYEDGVAKREKSGVQYDEYTSEMNYSFSHNHSEEQKNLYLVLGKALSKEDTTVDMQWQKTKEITAIDLQPASSYKMWNGDFSRLPVIVSYSDGSRETYDKWIFYRHGLGDYYKVTTANNNVIKLNMQEDNQTIRAYSINYWKPGTTSWIATVKDKESISDTASICIENPTIQNFDINSEKEEKFDISAEHAKFYSFYVEDNKQKINVFNDSSSELTIHCYYRTAGSNDEWNLSKNWSVSGYKEKQPPFYFSDKECLLILSTDSVNIGSIGRNVSRTCSATVNISSFDLATDSWASIPVTLTYLTSSGDVVGTREINSWEIDNSYLVAIGNYGEKIYCRLYKDKIVMSFEDVMTIDEFKTYLKNNGENPDDYTVYELRNKAHEMGINIGEQPGSGTYTLYISSRQKNGSEYNIGSQKITVKDSAAKAPGSVATKITMSSATKVKISWNKSANADGYVIYRATSKNGTYKKVADVKADAVSYTDSGLTYGKTYYYKVKAYCKNGDETLYSEDSSVISVKLTLGKTTLSSAANSSSGVELKWSKVAGATGYYVYRKADSGSYSKIKTVSSGSTVSYTDKSVKNGTKYTYKVVAYYGKNTGSYNTKTIVRLTRPTISSAKNSSSKAIAVKWNKNTKATGYQVKYVTGSTTKTVTVSKNSTLSYTIKKLAKGKTYKVYVRSYKTVSGTKHYSAWSSAKSVKVSK